MSGLRFLAPALASAVLTASAVAGEIKIVEREDGSKYVYNVRPKRSSARYSRPAAVSAVDTAIDDLIERYAQAASLDAKLVRFVIQAESAFDPRARSSKGAMGLMQLMPETAESMGVADPYDPEQNLRAGTRYLGRMLKAFGSTELALAAYNAGPEAVRRFRGIPPYRETRDYVEKIMRLYSGDASYRLSETRFVRQGRKTYVRRDAAGRLVMTTTPPAGG